MKTIEDNQMFKAQKEFHTFCKQAPEEYTKLVISYIDTFVFVKTGFESQGFEASEQTILEITKEILNKVKEI